MSGAISDCGVGHGMCRMMGSVEPDFKILDLR